MLPDQCPWCLASLEGEPIPEERQDLYGGTHFSRLHGVEVRGVYDGVLYWQCPDCGWAWHRFPEGHPLRDRAEPYVEEVTGVFASAVEEDPRVGR